MASGGARHRTRVLILGAAGRDFHNFNTVFRDDPTCEVVAFTAAQIPNIAGRTYPPALAGELYPQGISILVEKGWGALVDELQVDQVVFAYSDISHENVMHIASTALAHGADFRLLGPRATMLRSTKPVISVCAVRTGCGKSPAARAIARTLRDAGLRVAVVRHPMPYGDLAAQAVQRFATLEDLRLAKCTIEEMEEYEPHIAQGDLLFAGVDYQRILRAAETESDVIIWDGGNNDLPFFVPDLEIVLVDPHRAGDERTYFPGEVNLLRADILVLAKLDTADATQVAAVRESIRAANPTATVVDSVMPLRVDTPALLEGARVLVIEDGPTLTHGGMRYGAGTLAARRFGARELVDPRPYAIGSIGETFNRYPHVGPLLPAMGYGAAQIRELEATINATPCDVVLIATPVDLRRVVTIAHPSCRLTYEFATVGTPGLPELLAGVIAKAKKGA
jgi:predicted GTPase